MHTVRDTVLGPHLRTICSEPVHRDAEKTLPPGNLVLKGRPFAGLPAYGVSARAVGRSNATCEHEYSNHNEPKQCQQGAQWDEKVEQQDECYHQAGPSKLATSAKRPYGALPWSSQLSVLPRRRCRRSGTATRRVPVTGRPTEHPPGSCRNGPESTSS